MTALFQGPDKFVLLPFGLGLEDLGNLIFHRLMSLLVSISDFHFLMLYGLSGLFFFFQVSHYRICFVIY